MKKLVLILSAVVVMIAFAVPTFAMEMYDPEQRMAKLAEEEAAVLKASGELTFGTVTSFDAPTDAIGFYNYYVDFTMWPDMYNSILLEVAGSASNGNWGGGNVGDTPFASLPYFELTTDVGGFLDLPVGLKNTAGRTSLYTNKYEVTGLAYERTLVRTWIDPLAWKFAVDADVVEVTAALGFGEGADLAGDGVFNDIGVYAHVPAVADIADIELWYLAQDNADFKGILGASVKVSDIADMISVAGGFMFNITDAAGLFFDPDGIPLTGDEFYVMEYAYGVGASAAYMDYTVNVSLNGYDENALNQFGVDADAKFGDFGVNAALGMAFGEDIYGADVETFQGAEFAGYVVVGNATWKVGYTIADGTGFAFNPAVAGPDGGLFVVADVDF
jgi:hypothetical protein